MMTLTCIGNAVSGPIFVADIDHGFEVVYAAFILTSIGEQLGMARA
jgi:hypothetical protein